MGKKYVLMRHELHFGNLKETFHRGAVIEHDAEGRRTIVDGRPFEDVRDVEIAIRHGIRNPDDQWLVPYTEEMLQDALTIDPTAGLPVSAAQRKSETVLPVVTSDEDLQGFIDISDTKVSDRARAEREAERRAAKDGPLPIIKGDETVEERLAQLEGKNDMSAMAERVRLKSSARKMEVVRDDSLGHASGSKSVALNAGQPLPSREEAEARTASAAAIAESRKQGVQATRKAAGVEIPVEASPTETGLSDLDELKAMQASINERIAAMESGSAESDEVEIEFDDEEDVFAAREPA